MKTLLVILLSTVAASADFKELNSADIDFAIQRTAKSLGACWKEPKRQVSIGIDSILNKTAQAVDKEKAAQSLVDALGKTAKFDVLDGTSTPRVRLSIQGKVEETNLKFQGTYTIETSIELSNGKHVCKESVVLNKSAVSK